MIQMTHIRKIYDEGKDNQCCALQDMDLQIEKGQMVAIIGASGSGKSTLLNIIGLMEHDFYGDYKLEGIEVRKLSMNEKAKMRNTHLGFVVQDFALIERNTVFQNVEVPLMYAKNKKSRAERNERIIEVLEKLGMEEKYNVPVHKLSGGQRQRVAIARAIVNEPEIILADEPTGALDSANTKQILQLLKEQNEEGRTVLIITHDMEVAKYCDVIYEMQDGKLRLGEIVNDIKK